jgi:TolA-binding protein
MAAAMESSERREQEAEAAADEMDRRAREMEDRADELGQRVSETRGDWQRKQQDTSVPGAEPDHEDRAGEVAGDWEGEGQAADEEGQ